MKHPTMKHPAAKLSTTKHSTIKLSDYVMRFLMDKGISHAFMLPGGGAMHLVDSLGKSGMDYTCFLHEQAAAVAAEAYGQHNNVPGLVLVTSGPGATNAVTGVAAGWIDSTPMIVISGQAKREDLIGDSGVRQSGSQEVQIIPMVEPVTKYAVQVMEPAGIRYCLERAYYEAVSGRPGPVWLSIPLDVQNAQIDVNVLEGYKPDMCREADISKEIERTAQLLLQSECPLFLAGNGIKLAGAQEEFYRMIKLAQVPAETTWKAADLFGEDDPLYLGHPGSMGDRGANLILQSADLLICIGSRLDTSITAFNEAHFGMSAAKVIVDIDPCELARMQVPNTQVSLACDAGQFIKELADRLEEMEKSGGLAGRQQLWKRWTAQGKALRARYPSVVGAHADVQGHVSAYYFIGQLSSLLREDDVIVPESSGAAGEITYQAFQLKKGQKMKNAAGLGSMGFGLPYAIGSCIANGRRRTILINGDGAFQLNIQELETLHRLKLPVKIFIWNNGGYASIRAMQRNNFDGRYVASSKDSGLSMPDLCRVAEAYGFLACRIADNRELDSMLPELLADDTPVVCELMVLPEETVSPRTRTFQREDGSIESSRLEHMWPPADEEGE